MEVVECVEVLESWVLYGVVVEWRIAEVVDGVVLMWLVESVVIVPIRLVGVVVAM